MKCIYFLFLIALLNDLHFYRADKDITVCRQKFDIFLTMHRLPDGGSRGIVKAFISFIHKASLKVVVRKKRIEMNFITIIGIKAEKGTR